MITTRTSRPIVGVLLGIVVVSMVVFALAGCGSSGGSGKVAPVFSATTLDGVDFSLTDYRGKALVLAFMASW